MIKKILVTTDLSTESKKALPVAKSFADKFGAELILLVVGYELFTIPASYGLEAPVYLDPSVQREIDERMQRDLEKVKSEEFGDYPVTAVLKTGSLSPVDGILSTVKELGADLLVMASHGRTGVQRVLLGSVTERVLRNSPCPVLVVPVGKAKKATET